MARYLGLYELRLQLLGVLWWLMQLIFVNANLLATSVTVQLIQQSTYFKVCESCDQGFFALENGTFDSNCHPCSTCEDGLGIRAPCNETHDTICEACAEGTYLAVGEQGRECFTCIDCLLNGRVEESPCTQTQDSICGSCAQGYFLYIDEEGSRCLQCSPCPEDRDDAVRWIECAEAGLDQDHQCTPGEVPSNSTTEVPTNQTATPEPEDVAIPTDRGGFVEQTETQPLTTAHPSKEIGIAITAVSAVFTFSTVVVFSCAVGYVSYVNRHKCVTCWNCLLPYLCIAKRNTSTPLLEEGSKAGDEETAGLDSTL